MHISNQQQGCIFNEASIARGSDRIEVTFDEPNLVANAGLWLVATLVARLGLESPINSTVRLSGRVGGAHPGRKMLTMADTMVAGGSHICHADVLRSGATEKSLRAPGDGSVDDRFSSFSWYQARGTRHTYVRLS